MEKAQDLAGVLVQSSRKLAEAMPGLRGFNDISHHTVELKRLENEGDRLSREALAALFREGGIDPMVVIRWKDIYADRADSAAIRPSTSAAASPLV